MTCFWVKTDLAFLNFVLRKNTCVATLSNEEIFMLLLLNFVYFDEDKYLLFYGDPRDYWDEFF